MEQDPRIFFLLILSLSLSSRCFPDSPPPFRYFPVSILLLLLPLFSLRLCGSARTMCSRASSPQSTTQSPRHPVVTLLLIPGLSSADGMKNNASGNAGNGGGGGGARFSLCVGCGAPIQDQFILRVAPNLEWHAACLKCCECQMFLDENCTCFVRDGKTYCKKDYNR